MGIINREGALYMATGVDNSGLYAGRRETIGIIKALTSQITSFDVFGGIGISAAMAFANAAKSSYDFEKEFHKNMLEVATISTQVSGSMTDFMNRVMAITQQIPVTAPEAAKALYQIVSAGHDGADGMKILEVSAKSAVGGLTATATAADAITTLLNAYKLSADQAANISDQLFTTVRLGKTDFGQLGQSIAQVAPIAASYGVEIDQVLAAVASLTKQGTPTAQAMTQIRAAIIGTSKVLGDGAFESRTFQEALAEVAARANGSESKLRQLVPEIEAVNGVLGMTGKNAKAAASDLSELQNSVGATEAAFEKMADEADNQMKLLSNNIHAALRPMGEGILREVSGVAKSVNEAFANGDAKATIKLLGDLIVIVTGAFIGYKGAILASTVAQRLNVAVLRQAVLERQMEKVALLNGVVGHQALTTAQLKQVATRKLLTSVIKTQTAALAKNAAAMLLNPYTLAAAAVAALGYALYSYATQATAAEKAQENLNARLAEQKRLSEEITTKTEDSLNVVIDETKANIERNKALKTLKELYPKIFAQYDVETLKLADILQLKKQIAEQDAQRTFQSDKEYFASLVAKRDKLDKEISYRSENYGNGQYKYGEFFGITTSDLEKEREIVSHEIDKLYVSLREKSEFIWQTSPREVKIVSLEQNIASLKKEKEELEKLLSPNKDYVSAANTAYNPIEGFVSPDVIARLNVVNNLLQSQSAELGQLNQQSEEQNKKAQTVLQRKLTLTKELAAAEAKLKKLRASDSTATDQEIDEAEKEVEEKKNALKALTGLSEKEGDKTKQDQKKIFADLLSLRLQNQQAEIDMMKEGSEKKIAQINLDYDREIATILAKEKEWKEAQGGKLTKEQTDEIRTSFVNAWVKKDKSTTDVNREQLESEKKAMNEYLIAYGTYQEKRKAIAEKYNAQIAKATTEGERLSLAEEMKKELAAVDDEAQKKTSIITKLFSDMSNRTVTDIRVIADEAQKMLDYINDGEFKTDSGGNGLFGLTKEQFDILSKSPEKLQAIKDEIANVRREADQMETSFNKVSNGLKKVFSAGDDAKELKEGLAEIEEGMNEVMQAGQFLSGAFSKLGDSFGGVFSGIAEGLNVAMDTMSSAMNGAKAGAMFGPIGSAAGAAIGVVSSLASAIAKIHDKKNEKRIQRIQEQVDALDRAYDKLGDSIEKAYSKDASELIGQQNEMLEQQKVLIQQQIREEEEKKKTDHDRIKQWENELEEIDRVIADNKEKAKDAIFGEDLKSAIDNFANAYAEAWAAGEDRAKSMKDVARSMIRQTVIELIKSSEGLGETVKKIREMIIGYLEDGVIDEWEQKQIDDYIESETSRLDSKYEWADKYLQGDKSIDIGISSDSLSDTILEGLQAGKSGIKDFSSSFEDMMKTAVLNSLKVKYLEGPLKEFQKKFTELSESGGQLTEAEIEELRAMYADIIDGAKVQFDSMKEISGLDFSLDSDNTLKGAFAKASQESIDLLAGQTGAQRVAVESIREQLRIIFDLQREGWADVRAIRELTVKIDRNSEQMAKNTDKIQEVAEKISESTKKAAESLDSIDNRGIKVKM